MKRFYLCMLLALAMLLAACGDVVEQSSVQDTSSFSQNGEASVSVESSCEESSEASAESSEVDHSSVPEESSATEESSVPEESDESSTPEQPGVNPDDPPEEPENPPVESISSIDRTLRARELAKGCKYTSSVQTNEQYMDDGTLLTDGNIPADFDSENWAGYIRPKNLTFVLDLGAVKDDLADFVVHSLRMPSYGIGTPATVLFEISTDGKSYRKIGKVHDSSEADEQGAVAYQIKLAEPVSARYVRFTFGEGDSAWLFFCELSVCSYLPDSEDAGLYYGDATLPQVDPEDYWPKAEQNTNEINLIAGKLPYIVSEEEIDFARATEYYNSINTLPLLTDGKHGVRAVYSDPALVHFTGALGRTLTFDLSHTSAVSGVMLRFLEEDSSGVHPPQKITVYVSIDGQNWERVYNGENSIEGTNIYQKKEINFDSVYKARFVRIQFSVASHVFCDEIQVYGTTAIPGNAKVPVPTVESETEDLGYVMPEDFLGVHNLLLSYHCLPQEGTHSEGGLITVEEYLPHVGYYDETGKLVDTFFDGFLYLPYTSFNYSDYAKSFEGWQFYVDDIYREGRNMDALNQAVGIVGDELNLKDYKCTVFTSILYTFPQLENKSPNKFGDIDGDGISDSFNSIENRKQAIKWIIDQEYQRFLEGGYDHLEFGGFYWFEEFLELGDPDEKELTLYASDYVHSLGLKLFWIPWYCASGYDKWQEYGFDVACMQPNYMFGNKENPDILRLTAEKTKRLGMCVEIEMNSVNNAAEVQRYMEYLAAGAEYGYMHAVKMYYQGGVPGAFHAGYLSEDPFKRAVYDMTYLFAKEKFSADPPDYTLGKTSFSGTGGVVNGKLAVESEKVFVIELAVSPEHGDLCLSKNGSFTYFAEDGFSGSDRFALRINFGYASSQEIVIEINVE